MNRTDFLKQLDQLLSDMPEEERQAAVRYYADYFEDAGLENEEDVIRELGSPEKVAQSIKADFYGKEFDETAFEQKDYMQKCPDRRDKEEGGEYAGQTGENRPWTNRWLKLLLIVLILIAVWPVALGAAGVVLGIAAAVVCFFAALVIAAVCIVISGAAVAVAGLTMLAVPPAGLVLIGIGLILAVAGLAATAGSVKLCCIVYPAMLRGFVNLCRRPFYGKAVS